MTIVESLTARLVEFLTARLDEDAAVALAAPGREWSACKQDDVAGASVYDEQWVLLYPQHYDHDNALSNQPGATGPMYIERSRDELCAHIARHDPSRALAVIDAHRAILAEFERAIAADEAEGDYDRARATNAAVMTLYGVLCHLASVYSDHPDFDAAWAPA